MGNLSFILKYLHYVTEREPEGLTISGVGIRERMRPGRVLRPGGTRDRLLMYFHTPWEYSRDGASWEAMPPGGWLLWPDGGSHFYGNAGAEWVHSWMHFHGETAEELIQTLNFPEQTVQPLPDSAGLEKALERLYFEVTHPNPDVEMTRLSFELVLRGIRRDMAAMTMEAVPEPIRKIKMLLDSGEAGLPSLTELAVKSGCSVSHFAALFRKYYGVSPIHYEREVQFRRAAYWLQDRSLSIAEIAARTGCAGIYAFSRAFRKRFGVSPSEWSGRREKPDAGVK